MTASANALGPCATCRVIAKTRTSNYYMSRYRRHLGAPLIWINAYRSGFDCAHYEPALALPPIRGIELVGMTAPQRRSAAIRPESRVSGKCHIIDSIKGWLQQREFGRMRR